MIPSEAKTLLQSGKLSTKKIPQGRFYELYQDYVSGCMFRVAREMFALLPVRMVIVHAEDEMVNPQTGHQEIATILSVAIPRETVEKLNFEAIDCSDALKNFVHDMNFTRTRGFSAVERLRPQAFEGTLPNGGSQ